ncbi:FAD-binding oxidoreductase [Frigidibacter sp. MR17.14]|uniref:NAD(P)/FAD-dependent oxidoreductase n=1 Tax=Frigidibacter sp. MR17.14 TaxID=3126509 RepID=UPI003012F1B9
MQAAARKQEVVVIGAGIVGAATALRLVQDGHRVTIVEPAEPGGPQAASHGNGAFLSPASIIPMSGPGLWRKVPGYLCDPAGALTIRWRHLPRLLPWLWRFLLSGWTEARVERTAAALNDLLQGAPSRHVALAEAIGRPELIRRDGLVYAFADRAALAGEALSWRLRRRFGVKTRELEAGELHARLPALADSYRFGLLVEDGGHCHDPGAYTAAIVAEAERRGARRVRAEATGFEIAGGRLRALVTAAGAIPCDAVVIAAGIRSKRLARAAGDRIPMESERGYHVEIAAPGIALSAPVMPQDGKMANTMTAGGLRASGQVELASEEAAPDWRRADILLGHLRRTWPGLATGGEIRRWQGNRPSTPDGRPVIGPARACPQIVHAFGHGHIGLASSPMTAEIVAALIAGREPPIDIAPFSPDRFR